MSSRLRFRPDPFEGESLIGFLWRVAERNHTSLSILYNMAGSNQQSNSPTPKTLEQLELITGCAVEVLNAMSYRTDDMQRFRRFRRHTFPIPLLSWKHRRFCPTCIIEEPFHRSIWDLSIVSACPRHNCLLNFQCDACGRSLEWRGDHLWECACGHAFTSAQVRPVPPAELLGTRFVFGLLDEPGFADAASPSGSVPPFADLRVVESLGLLHTLTLERAIHERKSKTAGAIGPPHGVLTGALLACSEWPTRIPGFLGLKRPSKTGPLSRWLESLSDAKTGIRESILAAFDDAQTSAIQERGPLISLEEAARFLETPEHRLRHAESLFRTLGQRAGSRGFLSPSLVQKLAAADERLLTSAEGAKLLGVSQQSFIAMADAGLLMNVKGKASGRGTMFALSEVKRLLDDVQNRVTVAPAEPGVRLIQIGASSSPALNGLKIVRVVQALLDQELLCAGIDPDANGLQRYLLAAREVTSILRTKGLSQ